MSSQNDPDDSREEPREQAKSQEQVEDVPFDTGRVDTCTADTGSSIYSADISTVEPVNVAPSGVNKGNDAILDTTSSNIVLSGADPSIDGPSNAELAAIEPPSTAPSEANRGNASPSDLEPSSAESPDTSLLGASQDNTIHLNPTPPNTIHSDASIGNSSAESSSNIASFDVEAFIAELVNITISDPDHERTTGSYTVSTEATPSSPAPSNVISPKTGPGKAKFSNIRNLNAESSEAGPSSSRLRADTGFPSTRDPPSNIASPEAPAYIDLTRQRQQQTPAQQLQAPPQSRIPDPQDVPPEQMPNRAYLPYTYRQAMSGEQRRAQSRWERNQMLYGGDNLNPPLKKRLKNIWMELCFSPLSAKKRCACLGGVTLFIVALALASAVKPA